VIVVDTNVICYRWMASPHAHEADAAWRKDPDWIVPIVWRSEFRNALAGALRRNFLKLEDATDIAVQAESQFVGCEFLPVVSSVLELVSKSNCSAYDCEFVSLAQQQRVQLVTVDTQVLRDFPDVAISLRDFVAS